MKNKISLIDRFTFSINPKKYVYLYKEKIGSAFLYILIISVILGLITGLMNIYFFSTVEETTKMFLKQENTKFEMKDGILDFEASPVKEEEGAALLYIDTDKNLSEVEELRSVFIHKEISTILLSDGIIVRSGSEEISYKYSDLGLGIMDFDNEVVISMLEQLNIIKYILVPIIIAAKYIQLMLYALFISLFGVLTNLMCGRKMPYGNIYNLSLYAATVPAIINLIIPIGSYSVIIGGIILMLGLNFVSFDNMKKGI